MDTAGSPVAGIFQPPPQEQLKALERLLAAPLQLCDRADGLPAGPGAYIVLLHLASDLVLTVPRFAGTALSPGWYVYAGSARGPGGIAARAGRHLKHQKTRRWHIDHVTAHADAIWAAAAPDMTECAIVRSLAADASFRMPVPGFGNTDCRWCSAHFLEFAGVTGEPFR